MLGGLRVSQLMELIQFASLGSHSSLNLSRFVDSAEQVVECNG